MNTAFFIVFGLFVLAILGLAFTAVRWGIRRDRAERRDRLGRAGGDTGP